MNIYWSNLLAWCIQIAIVVAASAALSGLLRLRASRGQLWYWHIILLISLALPLLQPWSQPASRPSDVTFTTGAFHIAPNPSPAGMHFSWPVAALVILTSGIALRLLWLGLGLYRLRRYRATAVALDPSAYNAFAGMRLAIAPEAEILVSPHVSSPVTFGFRRPVILLPDRFAGLAEPERASIVCHELIHIRRRDWTVAIAEELLRSFFWFHPAIWWLLGRIQLTREQVVDQQVIGYTGDHRHYLDALLAIASLRLSADLAPAPLFLKKRHLRQRVESIISGVPMTKRNLLLPLAAAFAALPLVIGIAAWQFPLRAAPQEARQEAMDDAGVDVQLAAARILHRTGISYPQDARAKQISGTVVANLALNDKGEVADAAVVSGPQELRRAVMQSVLNWHFSQDSGPTPEVQIAVHFDASKGAVTASRVPPAPTSGWSSPVTIASVDTHLLPAALRGKVEQSGLLQVGSTVTGLPDISNLSTSLRNLDEHLRLAITSLHEGKMTVAVMLAGQAAPHMTSDTAGNSPKTIRVGGNVQAANILQKVRPKYPVEAKLERIQGLVRLNATIGADGLVKDLQVIEGPPELVPAALDAVRQWVYRPTLLNGNPVAVITTIDINFTLLP